MEHDVIRDWGPDERRLLIRALRRPRGRYSATRASQLAGVPERTVYDWAKAGVVEPDFAHGTPKQWSYRDLVFLRMMAWLRSRGMPRATATDRVDSFRDEFSRLSEDEALRSIRSDGRSIFRGDESIDSFTGQALLDGAFLRFMTEFELVVPAETKDLGTQRLWGPDLLRPAERVYIDPWVMGGDPCVRDTRIPTSTLYALQTKRGLTDSAIVALYPGAITAEDVTAASHLERSLRSHQKLAA